MLLPSFFFFIVIICFYNKVTYKINAHSFQSRFYFSEIGTAPVSRRARQHRKRDRYLELAAVGDDNLGPGGAAVRAERLHGLDDLHALDNAAEDDVLAVEPRGLDGAEEELRAVGAGASVGHGEHAGAGVLEGEVLVRELGAVDRLATRAVVVGEVTLEATKEKEKKRVGCWSVGWPVGS